MTARENNYKTNARPLHCKTTGTARPLQCKTTALQDHCTPRPLHSKTSTRLLQDHFKTTKAFARQQKLLQDNKSFCKTTKAFARQQKLLRDQIRPRRYNFKTATKHLISNTVFYQIIPFWTK